MNAPDKAAEIKAAAAALIAFGTALFGWVGWMVVLWLIALLLDYLTGTFAALYNKSWSSAAARQGLWHKLGSIIENAAAMGAPVPGFLKKLIVRGKKAIDDKTGSGDNKA